VGIKVFLTTILFLPGDRRIRIQDPDTDPGGPKTCGSGGSDPDSDPDPDPQHCCTGTDTASGKGISARQGWGLTKWPNSHWAEPNNYSLLKCSHLEKAKGIEGVPLCLFVKTSPINFAGMGGNGNESFTGKQHVQTAYNPRSPRSEAEDK
jgi:hypothetical protein